MGRVFLNTPHTQQESHYTATNWSDGCRNARYQ